MKSKSRVTPLWLRLSVLTLSLALVLTGVALPGVARADSVTVRYDVEAINGKLIYKDIEESYVAGRRQQMIGLDQAVLQLRHGSRAKVILPSNLAYGIGGDGDRITQSAILIIDVEVE